MVKFLGSRERRPSGAVRNPARPGPRPGRGGTGRTAALAVTLMLIGLMGAGAEIPAVHPEAPDQGEAKAAPAGAGGHFEPNLGQFPDHVRFVVRGAGMHAFLTDGGATFVLEEPAPALPADAFTDPLLDPLQDFAPPEPEPASLFAVQLRFEDADPGTMEGTEPRPGISSHFIGNDPDKWVTDVPHYGRVVQRNVWPGIDVEWHIAPQGLKFDAVVHPGADAGQVRFVLPGAEGLTLDAVGDLAIGTPLGSLMKEAPYTYQETTMGQQEVPSRYVLTGGAVGFEVDGHDPSKPLVIDPLIFSTYAGTENAVGDAIAVDDEGFVYVGGTVNSGDTFPETTGPHGAMGNVNTFVFKLTPEGDEVVYSMYFGCSAFTHGRGIAVDAMGSVHLAGWTNGNSCPTPNGLLPGSRGRDDGFVAKFSPFGNQLLYGTYLGGSGNDYAVAITVDDEDGTYVAGHTNSYSFPTTLAAAQPNGGIGGAAFVVKLNTTASGADSLVYGTFLGGNNPAPGRDDHGWAVAVDAEGHAYVTGSTESGTFPVTDGAFQRSASGTTAFVTKLTPTGNGYVYSTYLGGSGYERGTGIAIDGAGHAYVVGQTGSNDFPTSSNTQTDAPSFQPEHPGGSGAVFLTKLNPQGSGLAYSTFVSEGGMGTTVFRNADGPGVAVDDNGLAFVAGWTHSDDFPTKNAFQEERRGAGPSTIDAFVAGFRPDGSELVWSTYFGGTRHDWATAVAVGATGSVHITGRTVSHDLPIRGAIQPNKGPSTSPAVYVAKLYGIEVNFDWIPNPPCPGEPVRFRDLSVSLSGTTGVAELPVRSEWDFGDGGGLRVLDPWQNSITTTYPAPGNYTVTLRTTDMNGATGLATHVVEVPWCPPPNHPPSLRALPCIIASPEQKLSFQVHASVPVFPDDPSSYSTLTFFAEGLPSGATFQQDGDFAARFAWEVGPPDRYTFVVHVEDGGLPEHDVPSLGDSREYCVEVRPEKPAPGRDDASGDGVQNWHDVCPYAKNPDQGGAAGGGLDDPCDPAAPPEPEAMPKEDGPPRGGCPSQPAGPREVTARWTDGAVQITWQSDSWCPPDHFLVWNGTGHHLVDFVVAEASVHYVVLNLDPWPEPHQYFVQAMGVVEGLFFDPARAVGSNLIDPAGCILEGARSEACLPLGIDEAPPSAGGPAGPEAVAPADGAPVGLIAAAVALVVGGLMALLWRLRHAPWFVHLFTRLGRDDVLEHPVRKDIMALVTAEPGIHCREIARRSGTGHGIVRHHLKFLAVNGAVQERKNGRYVCYYPAEGTDRRIQEVAGLLKADVAQRLLRLLQAAPGLPMADLARRLDAHPTTVGYHLRRFEKGGLARIERHASKAMAYPGELAADALATILGGGA